MTVNPRKKRLNQFSQRRMIRTSPSISPKKDDKVFSLNKAKEG
jgi:hypothetical protein